ncbi:Dabb family protein [Actinomycetospora termitidis]|uniref:Dabb family protein n=1 Tax=Actinomycetospora termitidis TaxID=3053470 RepID=A0ABT7MET3_9PSEU|nr:Dabb family protein [Actinomycetospora sp. Odt1-22]MDL5159180.1 Dabb family protein [Actinomycetospora sp. Odt1-22]
MAVTHVVTFTWVEGTSTDTVAGILAALQEWIDRKEGLDGLESWQAGSDIGVNEGNAAFAVSATFTDRDAYLRYRDHPEHKRIIAEQIAPLIAARSAVQFDH